MSLAYDVLYAQKCRSTHHKLAMDALLKLRTENRQRWIDLFLYYIDWYLDGAKAPDTHFKDFRNHVLHVGENNWGGALKSAREWFDKTVDLFKRRDWPAAVYSAGVLSHYFTDPFQPFHTGQSEAEGVVHRAEEWSICRAYNDIRRLIGTSLGYPHWDAPTGDDWLEQMILRGAREGHEHYQVCIDHYNIDLGVRNPPAGLDDEIRERIGSQIALATVGFARVLERVIHDGGATADAVPVSITLALATANMPVQAVRDFVDQRHERIRVNEMYAEFKVNGKVIKTLPEDDRAVRKAHAAEVLQVPIAKLDAEQPKAPGSKHGTYEPRVSKAKTANGTRRRYNIHGQPIGEGEEIFRRIDQPVTTLSAAAKVPVVKKAVVEIGAGKAAGGVAVAEPKAEMHELLTVTEPVTKNVADPREKQGSALLGGGDRLGKDQRTSAPTPKEPAKTPPKPETKPITPDPKPGVAESKQTPSPKPADLFDFDSPTEDVPKSSIDWGAIKSETAKLGLAVDRILKGDKADLSSDTKTEAKAETKPATAAEQPKNPLVKSLLDTNAKPAPQPVALLLGGNTAPKPTQPVAAPSPTPAPSSRKHKHYLNLEDDIEAAPSIGPKQAARLAKQGIRSVKEFLAADPEELADKLGLNHISGPLILDWQKQAKLNAAIPNLRGHDAQILVGCGITEPAEVAAATPEALYDFVKEFVTSSEGQRVLRGSTAPDLAEVKEWIAWAKDARRI